MGQSWPMALQAVMFDMDGLLIDTEPVWMAVEVELVAELGGTWNEANQADILGLALPRSSAYIKAHTGSAWPAERIGAELVGRFESRLATAQLTIQPGAASLVNSVAAAGLPFALVSASPRSVVNYVTAALTRAGFAPFTLTVAGDEVERGKPDPQPYLRAAAGLGADPRACVVLEDSANGVAAGWASGAVVVALNHMVDHQPGERVIVRSTLDGLDVADLRALLP